MKYPNVVRRIASAASLACVLAVLAGCSCEETKNGQKSVKSPAKAAKLFVEDRYFAITAAKKSHNASGLVRPPVDLWQPFRFELTFGLFAFKNRAGAEGGMFGVQLDGRGPDPDASYRFFATPEGDGLRISVVSEAGMAGSRLYANTTRLDAAIEHDGANLKFYARQRFFGAGGNFDLVATIPNVQTVPLNAGLAVIDIGNGAEVGFDNLILVRRGEPPVPPDAVHKLVDDIYVALVSVNNALSDIDGLMSTDTAASDAHMADALTKFAAVRAQIVALPGKSGPSPKAFALSKIDKAIAGLEKAKATLAKNGDYPGINATAKILIKKVGYAVFDAGNALLPQDLRDSLPGH